MPSLSLTSEVHVFACPHCGQTINTSMHQCEFCGVPIDRAQAEHAAEATSRISQAVSDASYLKIMAWMLLTFFLLMFIPLIGMAGALGLWFLRFAIPFMAVRWWVRYGKIQTTDPEFPKAKRIAIATGVIGVLALVSGFLR